MDASQSEPAQAPYILLANHRYIHKLSLDGSRLKTIISEPNDRTGIYAVDYHIRYDLQHLINNNYYSSLLNHL